MITGFVAENLRRSPTPPNGRNGTTRLRLWGGDPQRYAMLQYLPDHCAISQILSRNAHSYDVPMRQVVFAAMDLASSASFGPVSVRWLQRSVLTSCMIA